jgi:transposase
MYFTRISGDSDHKKKELVEGGYPSTSIYMVRIDKLQIIVSMILLQSLTGGAVYPLVAPPHATVLLGVG